MRLLSDLLLVTKQIFKSRTGFRFRGNDDCFACDDGFALLRFRGNDVGE